MKPNAVKYFFFFRLNVTAGERTGIKMNVYREIISSHLTSTATLNMTSLENVRL